MDDLNEVEILLVEDNPDDASLALRSLTRNKVSNRVHLVKDGAEALDFIHGGGDYTQRQMDYMPKLILLDLKLPKVDGVEVLRQIKGDERTKTIPVVVLTSSHLDRDIGRCYELGVNSYIVKPVEFEAFAKAVVDLGFYWLLLNKPPR